MREMLGEYKYGVFIRLSVSSDQITRKKAVKEDRIGIYRRKSHGIVSKIESQAFSTDIHSPGALQEGFAKRPFAPTWEVAH